MSDIKELKMLEGMGEGELHELAIAMEKDKKMIYFDGVHLLSDSNMDELHEFAQSIGLKREWVQYENRPGCVPHYDILSKRIAKLAYKKGAKKPEKEKLIKIIRYWKKINGKHIH